MGKVSGTFSDCRGGSVRFHMLAVWRYGKTNTFFYGHLLLLVQWACSTIVLKKRRHETPNGPR